jgi:hypothetical protein
MVVIFVMDGKFIKIFAVKFAFTPCAYPRIELKCLFPITLFPLFPAAMGFSNYPLKPTGVNLLFLWHVHTF